MCIIKALWNWEVSYLLAIVVTETEESELRAPGIAYSDAGPRSDHGETRQKLRSDGQDSLPTRRIEGGANAAAVEATRERSCARLCG